MVLNIESFNKQTPNKESQESIPQQPKQWSQDDTTFLLGNIEILKKTENLKNNPEMYEKKTHETYSEIKDFFRYHNAEYFEDVNELYRQYNASSTKIVRREDPLKILQLVNGKSIEINFDPEVVGDRGDKYANCALWPHGSIEKTNGIANAFLEGRGMAGPIVLLGGYTPNDSHMNIEEPDEKMLQVGNISRENIKILSGSIEKEDLDFVIMRIAIKFFNQEELTSKEKILFEQGKLSQVFRGFKFK